MKFEEFLMETNEEQHKRLVLEKEVTTLQQELDGQQMLNNVLQCALNGSVASNTRLFPFLPHQVLVLLGELAMVEEEIIWLERKVEELKLQLYKERSKARECGMRQQESHRYALVNEKRCKSHNYDARIKESIDQNIRATLCCASDIQSRSSSRLNGEVAEISRRITGRTRKQIDNSLDKEGGIVINPNKLSEEMLKCLVGIFLELNQTSSLEYKEGSVAISKLTLSCMNSKGFIPKTSISCKSPSFLSNCHTSKVDPYGILPDTLDGSVRDVGPYKNFIQITRSSFEISRLSDCLMGIQKIRALMHKLCNVDLTFLTYKQKLAFWINIYNATIMHAFLEHGLPSTQEKLLTLMNKAALNVGGIVLNALAIEHFILRYPNELKHGPVYEKEVLLRHAYGLGYPEPNVTFALCRGSWSSPALRVYTPENIVDEMERAKVEYLEASVGVTSKKIILVPKLLQWHMYDFAGDIESLLEWIYSQLPRSGSLKRLVMECLNGEMKSPLNKMVEIQPYESEFRYLLPV